MNLSVRLVRLNAKLDHLVEFGPLGSAVNYRVPAMYKEMLLPAGSAAYSTPSVQRLAKSTDPRARKGGAIYTPYAQVSEREARMAGYPNSSTLDKAIKRHEVVHSIQSAKRGYKIHRKIRDLAKDEIGAYSTMNRGIKGGSKVLRGINNAAGLTISVGTGIANNPRLQKRAAMYGAGAAVGGGAILGYKALKNRKKDE